MASSGSNLVGLTETRRYSNGVASLVLSSSRAAATEKERDFQKLRQFIQAIYKSLKGRQQIKCCSNTFKIFILNLSLPALSHLKT